VLYCNPELVAVPLNFYSAVYRWFHKPPRTGPMDYLGVPISAIRPLHRHFQRTISEIQACIPAWEGQLLSFPASSGALSSCIGGHPSAFNSLLSPIPKQTLLQIESILRGFLWSSSTVACKVSLVGWHKVCLPKEVGGPESSANVCYGTLLPR